MSPSFLDYTIKCVELLTAILGFLLVVFSIFKELIKRRPGMINRGFEKFIDRASGFFPMLYITLLILLLVLLSNFCWDEFPWPTKYKTVNLELCETEVCCAPYCDTSTPNASGSLEYRMKWWSFIGKLKVEQLSPQKWYLFSIHNIPYDLRAHPLPDYNEYLVETYADIVRFRTDNDGAASASFDFNRIYRSSYSVQPRLKVLGNGYKNVLCQCINYVEFRITSVRFLIIWAILLLLDVILLFLLLMNFIRKSRK